MPTLVHLSYYAVLLFDISAFIVLVTSFQQRVCMLQMNQKFASALFLSEAKMKLNCIEKYCQLQSTQPTLPTPVSTGAQTAKMHQKLASGHFLSQASLTPALSCGHCGEDLFAQVDTGVAQIFAG